MPKTIEEILETLNKSTPGQIWLPVTGVHALTKVTNDDSNNITFNPASGIIVKSFWNQTTGEIKLFPAKMLGYPENKEI